MERIVERLDSESVPRENKTPLRFLPKRHGKHTPQLGETLRIPFSERLQDNFGITMARETMAQGLEFTPKRSVIVDLAVENGDKVATICSNRLVAAFEIAS